MFPVTTDFRPEIDGYAFDNSWTLDAADAGRTARHTGTRGRRLTAYFLLAWEFMNIARARKAKPTEAEGRYDSNSGFSRRQTLRSILGIILAAVLAFLGIDSATAQTYSVQVVSWTTSHTRAHKTDTIYISLAGSVLNSPDWAESLVNPKTIAACKGLQASVPICLTVSMGDYKNGLHNAGYGKEILYRNVNNQVPESLPVVSFSFDGGSEPDQSALIAISIWNYGFPKLVYTPSDLPRALLKALEPMLITTQSAGPVSLIKSLNHHPWLGCDGPVIGAAFRFSGAELARMTAAGPHQITVDTTSVRSQVGCGASSKYSVTFSISSKP